MWRIKQASIERVRIEANFVAVVEEATPLRRAGVRLVGRCPFHQEPTGNFSIDPAKGLYHCFACGKGGDMIQYVRETRGVSFTGAIEWLAQRFGIPLSYEELT